MAYATNWRWPVAHETKYHVFAGPVKYPGGGMADHLGSYDRLSDAVRKATTGYDWSEIYATTMTGELEEVPREQW